MRKQLDALADTADQRAYLREIRRRTRRSTWSARGRYVMIHFSWIVVLAAGAAVSLVEVFGWSRSIAALLGFVVVVFQGVGRIFGRTAAGGEAMDVLRRGLAREQRQLLVADGPYADATDAGARFTLFADRCEELLGANDEAMVEYFAHLAEEPMT